MNKNSLYTLFVYGSLRKGFQNPAYAYISNYFTLVSTAIVQGCLYDLGEYPAAQPTAAAQYITGELYTIKNENEFDWAMAQIDDYEGVYPEAGQTPLYRRDKAAVQLADGSSVDAWVYWYNGDVTGKPLIASGDVLEYLKNKQG